MQQQLSELDTVIAVENPATTETIATVPSGDATDVDRAVAAAVEAFPAWAATAAEDRVKLVERAGEELAARADDMAATISAELGAPLAFARRAHVGLPLGTFRAVAALVDAALAEETFGTSLVVREPIGVVGAITPWNYPLHQIVAKVAPAIAAGCTVVLKPADLTPLCALAFADILRHVGLPPGVLNVVTGPGRVVGEAMATHPDIDMISFTGSNPVGRRVQELAAGTVKRVGLELGGKSAGIVLDDADLDATLPRLVESGLMNSGQTCAALTRLVVPRHRLAEVEDRARAMVAGFTVGDPLDPETGLGPVVSAAQRETVLRYIRTGVEEGAKLLAGSTAPADDLGPGYFVRPAVFTGVDNRMRIAQEEIFGPVLCLIAHDGDDDAVAIANDSPYGLYGGVWSGDDERAEAVARRLRTGAVSINGAAMNPLAPFGGYKQSGNGRELGRAGIEEFCELKAIHRPT
jgi:aldehyde dehydrogenase (NAD+)